MDAPLVMEGAQADTGRAARCGGGAQRLSLEGVRTTRVVRLVKAPRTRIYEALVDADAIPRYVITRLQVAYVLGERRVARRRGEIFPRRLQMKSTQRLSAAGLTRKDITQQSPSG